MKQRIRFFHPDENKGPVASRQRPYKRKNDWTDAEKQLLRDNWDKKTLPQLAELIGRTQPAVTDMGYRNMKLVRPPALRALRSPRIDAWSDAEKQLLIDNYQTMSVRELATLVGRSYGSTKTMAQRVMQLKKSPQAVASLMARVSKGHFRKGNQPHNTIHGDELVVRVRKNKKKPPSKWIRTGFKQWQMYHVYQWEQHYGPVPDGKIIVFRDKNTMNCEPDNLEAITRQELASRNVGSTSLKDGFVAHTMAPKDPELKAELLNHPDLLDLKRTQIQLNRAIKAATTHDNPKSAKAR